MVVQSKLWRTASPPRGWTSTSTRPGVKPTGSRRSPSKSWKYLNEYPSGPAGLGHDLGQRQRHRHATAHPVDRQRDRADRPLVLLDRLDQHQTEVPVPILAAAGQLEALDPEPAAIVGGDDAAVERQFLAQLQDLVLELGDAALDLGPCRLIDLARARQQRDPVGERGVVALHPAQLRGEPRLLARRRDMVVARAPTAVLERRPGQRRHRERRAQIGQPVLPRTMRPDDQPMLPHAQYAPV